MELLASELKVQNRTLRQLERDGRVALYALYGANGLLYGFEVVLIRVRKAGEVFGKAYPEREVYPSSEDWGTLAWSYGRTDRALAEASYRQLCRAEIRAAAALDDPPRGEGKHSGTAHSPAA
jgi:hypothetical protein